MRIGILLVEMPHMLHDVVCAILDVEPDLDVVADDVEAGTLVDRVERDRPDVVVLCVESGAARTVCEDLLRRFPKMAVVALEDRGEGGTIYMMRPTRFRVAEISRTQLVRAIRRATRPVRFRTTVGDAGLCLTDATTRRSVQN